MLNFILALFAEYTTMSSEEAKALAERLNHSIQPSRYDEAARFIKETVKETKKK